MANQIDDKPSLPNKYVQLEYLEATGTQWINTLIVPENGCWVIIDSQKTNTNTDSFILGADSSSNGKGSFNINDYTPRSGNTYNMQTYFRYGQNDEFCAWKQSIIIPFLRKTFFMDSKGFRVTSNMDIHREGSFTKDADFSQNKGSIALFALLRADGSISTLTFTGRIYEYIYGVNAGERMHLIPALRKVDSKPGMYDLITGQFFTNKGTGEFGYG